MLPETNGLFWGQFFNTGVSRRLRIGKNGGGMPLWTFEISERGIHRAAVEVVDGGQGGLYSREHVRTVGVLVGWGAHLLWPPKHDIKI